LVGDLGKRTPLGGRGLISREGVVPVALVEGENDGDSWLLLGKIGETFVYVEGWCDYTGWDCGSAATGLMGTLNSLLVHGIGKEEGARLFTALATKED